MVFAVLLLVVPIGITWSAGAALGSGPPASYPFSFPYVYATPPSPPASDGAHSSGLNVPRASIGPHIVGKVGATGLLGPVNGSASPFQTSTPTTVEVVVRNGSLASFVAGSRQHIALRNMTFGTWVNATSNAAGFANLTATVGWYTLNVTPSSTSTRVISFTQVWLSASPPAITRYLIPTSSTTASIGNGPGSVTTKSYFVQVDAHFDYSNLTPQIVVQLKNESGGDAILAQVNTSNNGTATFTHLDKNFDYHVAVIGYNNPYTGVKYYAYNLSDNDPTSQVTPKYRTVPFTTTTGVLTGTAIPANYQCCTGGWANTASTTIVGGVTYWSIVPNLHTKISFVNALVFINSTFASSGGWYNGSISYVNSTVIFLEPGIFYQFNNSVFVNNSREYGTEVRLLDTVVPGYKGDGVVSFLQLNTGRALGSVISTAFTKGAPSGTITNTLVDNVTTGGGSFTFVRDTLKNDSLNSGNCPLDTVTNSYLLNVTFLCGPGKTVLTNDVIQYSDILNNHGNLTATNTYLNLSLTQFAINGGKQLAFGSNITGSYDNLTNDYLSVQQSPWYPFLSLKATSSSSQAGSHNTFFWEWAGRVNITATIWNMTQFPMVNLTVQPYILAGYDDDFELNYTNAQALAGGSGFAEKLGSFVFSEPSYIDWNYSILNGATMYTAFCQANCYYSHDLFPLTTQLYPFAQTQYFGIHHLKNNYIRYTNDTWVRVAWNQSVLDFVHAYQEAGSGLVAVQDLGGGNPSGNVSSQNTGPGSLNFTYDTFDAKILGTMGTNGGNWLLLGQQQITSNVSHTVFLNSPAYVLGGPTWNQPTYGYDALTGGQNNTFVDDWFYNLTNQTAPLGSNFGAAGGQGPPQWGSIAIVGCRFFYAPVGIPGLTTIQPYGPWLPAENRTGSPLTTDPVTNGPTGGFPTQSTLTYEIPEGLGSKTTDRGGTYVFNTSNLQAMPPAYVGYNNVFWSTAKAYSWGVAPDVNVSSGTPVISYGWGFIGGPQPNFTWAGHKYSTSVEASYVNVSADSHTAPAIEVGLVSPPGLAALYVYNASSGVQLSLNYVTVPPGGMYNATFTPSNESAGVVFSLIPFSSPFYHGDLAGLIMLSIGATIAASFIVFYISRRDKHLGEWWG